MSEAGEIVGMVDVLKLTYATLDQINTMGSTDNEGPAWNKFWQSLENESESMMSGEGGSRAPQTPDARSHMSMPHEPRPGLHERGDSVLPNDSASHHGIESPDASALGGAAPSPSPYGELAFPFKFKAPSGRMHRVQVNASAGVSELVAAVAQKLGAEAESIGGIPEVDDGKLGKEGFALSYLDNEGDTVSITTDRDLIEAIMLASQVGREKVDLFVHDPKDAPLPPTVDPQPALSKPPSKPPTPPESILRERTRYSEEDEEGADAKDHLDRPRRRQQPAPFQQEQEQVIQGVPNELLLPGAIVTLAVVIVGVFVISRASSR
jgi:PB1 domain